MTVTVSINPLTEQDRLRQLLNDMELYSTTVVGTRFGAAVLLDAQGDHVVRFNFDRKGQFSTLEVK